MANIQAKYRNCQTRTKSNSAGEHIVAGDDNISTTEGTTVTSIPANVILENIKIVGIGIDGSIADCVVASGSTNYTTLTVDNGVFEVDCSNRLVTAAEAITFTPGTEITKGKIIVIAEYLELDTVTGRRVTPVE